MRMELTTEAGHSRNSQDKLTCTLNRQDEI